jgi:hypothetical protein
MFQRLQICQNLVRKIASENNVESIEDCTKYFNPKVATTHFKVDDWQLMIEHNGLNKNRKLEENLRGPFSVTQANKNGTVLIRSKSQPSTIL